MYFEELENDRRTESRGDHRESTRRPSTSHWHERGEQGRRPTASTPRASTRRCSIPTTPTRAADAVLRATPMYHGSVTGGSFPTAALKHLCTIARALDAWVLRHRAAVPDSHAQLVDGTPIDPALETRIERLSEALVEYAGVVSYPDATGVSAGTRAEAGG